MKSFNQWSFESDELALQTAQDKAKYITVFSSFTTGAHGEISGREGIIYDTTERRLAEEKQAELLQQLEKTNRELEAFALTIEHDLQMPLQAIQTLMQGIVADDVPQLGNEGKERLEQLTAHVQQMRDMMDRIAQHSGIGIAVDA